MWIVDSKFDIWDISDIEGFKEQNICKNLLIPNFLNPFEYWFFRTLKSSLKFIFLFPYVPSIKIQIPITI